MLLRLAHFGHDFREASLLEVGVLRDGEGAGMKELNLFVFNKGGYLRLAPIFSNP
jgi:hypothetical protein